MSTVPSKKDPVEESPDDNKIVSGPTPDPFDAKALRLPPAFEVNAGIRKQLTTVPVRKPHPQEWIRVNPNSAYRGNYGVIWLKEDNEVYLLAPAMIPHYENEMTRVMMSAFRTKTSRNQPSNAKFIFGTSTWIRGFIKPPPAACHCLHRLVEPRGRHRGRLIRRREYDGRLRYR